MKAYKKLSIQIAWPKVKHSSSFTGTCRKLCNTMSALLVTCTGQKRPHYRVEAILSSTSLVPPPPPQTMINPSSPLPFRSIPGHRISLARCSSSALRLRSDAFGYLCPQSLHSTSQSPYGYYSLVGLVVVPLASLLQDRLMWRPTLSPHSFASAEVQTVLRVPPMLMTAIR